ncbi:MAG: DUF6055 domain-containing protein [Bryobacteraceae bacterium]
MDDAATAAVHEMCHVVCFNQPGMRGNVDRGWRWIAEGTAVWAETLLGSDPSASRHSKEYLFYALNWCDRPEVPLDSEYGMYQAFLFVRYLVSRFGGDAFVGNLWRAARVGEDPWNAIQNLTGQTTDDLFAEYSAEAYLLNDPASPCYSPEVFSRFGPRALTSSVIAVRTAETPIHGSVWGLGCRYYRVDVPVPSSLDIECAGDEWGIDVTLVAGAATASYQRVAQVSHQRKPGTLAIPLTPIADHIWLTVCGKAGRRDTDFSLVVTAR